MSFISATIWLNALWLVACLPIISAPAATAALLSESHHLLTGSGVRWRRFVKTLLSAFRTSVMVSGILVPLWLIGMLAIVFGSNSGSPISLGISTVALFVVAVLSAVTALAVSTAPDPVITIFRRAGIAVLIRPGTCILMTLPAFAVVLTLVFAPRWVLGLAVFGFGALAAECTQAIAKTPIRSAPSRAGTLKRMVLDAESTSEEVIEFVDFRR